MPPVRPHPSLLVVLLACTAQTAWADPRPATRIHHAEPIDLPAAALPSEAALQQSGRPVQVRFEAFGRSFELELESNASVLRALPAAERDRLPAHTLYKGRLSGLPDSWLRVTRVNGRVYGAISDGTDLYAIAPARAIAGLLQKAVAGGPNATLMYRAADVESGLGPGFCGAVTTDTADTGADQYEALIQELASQKVAAAHELTIGLVADVEFRQRFADPQDEMLSRLNTVDGIFGAQVGVGIVATELHVLADNGGLTETDAKKLLRQLSTLRATSIELRSRGLTHLMTGRDLDGTTAGIAYIDGLCDKSFGASLSEQVPDPWIGALIAAHEIGHNFGAEHDGEAKSVCESTAQTFLMAPSINGNGVFSQCSLDTVAPIVARASCKTVAGVVDLALEAPAATVNGFAYRPTTVAFDVVSLGNQPAASATVTLDTGALLQVLGATVANGTCRISVGSVVCDLGSVAADERRRIELQLQGNQAGQFVIAATLATPLDDDATNDRASVTLVLDGAADGALMISPSALSGVEQQVQRASILLTTGGVEALSGVTLRVAVPADVLVVETALAEQGSCTVSTGQVSCSLGSVAAASTRRVDLDLRGTRAATTTIEASLTADNDADSRNNRASATVGVAATAGTSTGGANSSGSGSSSGKGGGGALDLALLSLLLTMLLMCGVTRRRS